MIKGGPSMNPLGPPRRGESWRDCIIQAADELPSGGGATKRELIVAKTFALALKGVPWAIQFIVERCEGKAPMGIFIQGGQTNPLRGLSDDQLAAILKVAESNFLKDDRAKE